MIRIRWFTPLLVAPLVGGLALAATAPAPITTRPAVAPKLAKPPKPGALAEPAAAAQTGLPEVLLKAVTPTDVRASKEVIELGKKLFFDSRVSADGTVSCASCHDPDKGFTDHNPTAVGIRNQVGQRNSPSVLNALFNETQFWDGRAATLELQAKLPILNPIEMGQKSEKDVVAALDRLPEYHESFMRLFGRPLNYDDLARAITAYELTQVALDSPFDHFLLGEEKAIDPAAKRGWTLFNGKGRCMSCHGVNLTQPLGTDNKFHNIGVAAHKQNFVALAREALATVSRGTAEEIDRLALETRFSELGRFLVTKQQKDVGAFKTPGLRNVLVTHPYFHDGSSATLWDVMDHYNKGGVQNAFLDGGITRLGLSENEIDDLVMFMASLTSSRYKDLGQKELARQRQLSRTRRPDRDNTAALGKSPGLTGPLGDVAPNPTTIAKDPARIGGR